LTHNLEILNYKYMKRNLNDSNYLEYKPTVEHFLETEELNRINLNRKINIEGLNKIFKDAQDSTKVKSLLKISKEEFESQKASFTDAFVGLSLHNLLRLSPSEASRPEVWNSLTYTGEEVLKYHLYRKNIELTEENKDLTLKDIFVSSTMGTIHQHNKISWPWWVVEVTRNGSDYISSLDAFKSTTYFTTRYIQSFLLHQRPIAIALSQYFAEFDKEPRRFNKLRREVLATKGADGLGQYSVALKDYFIENRVFENIEYPKISQEKFQKWQESSSSFSFKSGPNDFEVTQETLDKLFKIFDDIGLKRGWIKTSA
jgi:hypothetical protein